MNITGILEVSYRLELLEESIRKSEIGGENDNRLVTQCEETLQRVYGLLDQGDVFLEATKSAEISNVATDLDFSHELDELRQFLEQ